MGGGVRCGGVGGVGARVGARTGARAHRAIGRCVPWVSRSSGPWEMLVFPFLFPLFRFRCRSCGIVVCADCSTHRFVLPSMAADKVRVQRSRQSACCMLCGTPKNPGIHTMILACKLARQAKRVCDNCFNRLTAEAARTAAAPPTATTSTAPAVAPASVRRRSTRKCAGTTYTYADRVRPSAHCLHS